MGYEEPRYLPTEEQIAAECAKIQEGWTERERKKRQAYGAIRGEAFIRARQFVLRRLGSGPSDD